MDSIEAIIFLNNQLILYTITKIDIFNQPKEDLIFVFILDSRYSSITFQGIILDNRAAGVSIAGLPQVIILSKLDLTILINYFITGNYWIKFSIRKTLFFRIIQVDTQLGNIIFHVFPTNTLFLFYL
jgi:hypothetical protein